MDRQRNSQMKVTFETWKDAISLFLMSGDKFSSNFLLAKSSHGCRWQLHSQAPESLWCGVDLVL